VVDRPATARATIFFYMKPKQRTLSFIFNALDKNQSFFSAANGSPIDIFSEIYAKEYGIPCKSTLKPMQKRNFADQ
jgi:hypothetical protein